MSVIRKIGNDNEIDRILNRDFVSPVRSGYVEVGDDNVCLPVYYESYAEKIQEFEVYDDDVFIAGHPKSGTTWTEEMVWLIVNNLDFESACKEYIFTRCALLESDVLFDYEKYNNFISANDIVKDTYFNKDYLKDPSSFIKDSKRPRCIKSHLHWSLLPEQIQNGTRKPKIITVLRNPADICVSYYYHCQTVESYKGNFKDFAELFLAGRVSYGPFWKQVLSYWEQKDRPNILFIKYKEMKDNLPAVIKKVSQFLGKILTEVQIEKLSKHLSFEEMKKNPAVNQESFSETMHKVGLATANNKFLRSGNIGDYKSKMTPELIQRFEDWTKTNLAGTGLSLD